MVGDISRMFVRLSPINFEVDKSAYFKEFCLVVRFAVWMDSSPIVDAKAIRALTGLPQLVGILAPPRTRFPCSAHCGLLAGCEM